MSLNSSGMYQSVPQSEMPPNKALAEPEALRQSLLTSASQLRAAPEPSLPPRPALSPAPRVSPREQSAQGLGMGRGSWEPPCTTALWTKSKEVTVMDSKVYLSRNFIYTCEILGQSNSDPFPQIPEDGRAGPP